MSAPDKELNVGDDALTDYNGNGITRVTIVESKHRCSHGKLLFRVSPPLKGGTSWSWYDADWFRPAP